MKIREAVVSDSDQLTTINRCSLNYDYPVAQATIQLQDLLESPNDKLLVCLDDDQICGYVHAAVYRTIYAPKLLNIMALAVHPDHQSKGYGKALMCAIEEWGLSVGAAGIRLNSGAERRQAHQFYEHLGFNKRKNQANYLKWLTTN